MKGQAFIMGELFVVHGLPAEGLSLTLRLLYSKICSLDKHWEQGLGHTWAVHLDCVMPVYLQQQN